ncbi:MAG TPA: aromatic ring-opening dioxygenase LigA [Dehalococcoidia bacterium]|nr:aromatic ring-opening dioxygenase LigA [Dehalococcoidia bacterium]
MKLITKWAWVGAIAFGFVLMASGGFMMYEGRTAHNEVRDTLADERIITSEDAGIPLAEVDSAAEAKAQADVIRVHILETTGGKTYAELDRSDPNRATYLNSVTLRTALMESYLAFKVSDLVVGMGAIVVLLGLSHVALGAFLGLLVFKSEAQASEKAVIKTAAAPAA